MIAARIVLAVVFALLAGLAPSWPTGDGLPAGPKATSTAKPAARPPAEITPAPAKRIQLPVAANGDRAAARLLGVAVEGFGNQYAYDRIAQLGAHWVRRYRELSWLAVEPVEGQLHWEVLAELEGELLRARADGFQPVINIQMTPEWAQGVASYPCGPVKRDKFEAFARFMEQVVARYGSQTRYGVHYWQIGNEPDVAPTEVWPDAPFGCWGDPNDHYYGGPYYADMLKVVYPRIKAADPGAQVMMAGLLLECDPETMSPGNGCENERRWASGRFLEGVLINGGGPFFDVVDVHSYAVLRMDLPQRMHSYYAWSVPAGGGTGLPEKIGFVRRILARYGFENKPVFAGEVALKCDDPTPECYEVGAAFVPRVYVEAYNLNLVGATYYALITEFKFKGLLLPDFTPKPAFAAYKYLGSQLGRARYQGAVTEFQGVAGGQFQGEDGRQLLVLWSADGSDVSLPLPAGFLGAYDKYGQKLDVTGGRLIAGWSPIYLARAASSR